jgi:hypothetical protein
MCAAPGRTAIFSRYVLRTSLRPSAERCRFAAAYRARLKRCPISNTDRALRDGHSCDETERCGPHGSGNRQWGEFSASFQPANATSNLTWGFAPGYKIAGLQPGTLHTIHRSLSGNPDTTKMGNPDVTKMGNPTLRRHLDTTKMRHPNLEVAQPKSSEEKG